MPRLFSLLLLALMLAHPAAATPDLGGRLKALALPRGDGTQVEWRPRGITVLSFVAFWCDTWKTQQAHLATAQKVLQGLPVAFITISTDDRWTERAPRDAVGTLLVDPDRSFSRSLGIDAVPYLVIVDEKGVIREAWRGIVRASAIEEAVCGYLAGKPAASAGAVYLAFDDFPSSTKLDEDLLDALRKAGVKASLFCRGDRVATNAEMIRRAVREGHSLQIHSWAHRADKPMLSRCVQTLQEIAGVTPTLYHPPGRTEFLRLNGEQLPVTVVNPYDYLRPGVSELTRRVLLAARPGCVILLHAGVSETIDAIPVIVRALCERQLAFAVLQ